MKLLKKAKRIHKVIAAKGGNADLSAVQEGLAQAEGFRDWNAAVAAEAANSAPKAVAALAAKPDRMTAGDRQLLDLAHRVNTACGDMFKLICGERIWDFGDQKLEFDYPDDACDALDEASDLREELDALPATTLDELEGLTGQAIELCRKLGNDEAVEKDAAVELWQLLNHELYRHRQAGHECDNCSMAYDDDSLLNEPEDLDQRIDPGGMVPSGECPVCGALCYPAENVAERTTRHRNQG